MIEVFNVKGMGNNRTLSICNALLVYARIAMDQKTGSFGSSSSSARTQSRLLQSTQNRYYYTSLALRARQFKDLFHRMISFTAT